MLYVSNIYTWCIYLSNMICIYLSFLMVYIHATKMVYLPILTTGDHSGKISEVFFRSWSRDLSRIQQSIQSEVFAAGPEFSPEHIKQYSRRLRNSILVTGDHPGSISEVFAAGPETSPEYIHQYNRRLKTGDHPS